MTTPSETHQQRAYGAIKARIINLEYKPGTILTDSALADELKMSRTPVREAFHRLEYEGLLINQQRRGWKVYSLSLAEIADIFEVKIAVEGMMARRAADCSDDRLREDLRAQLEAMRAAVRNGDPNQWLGADKALHRTIASMAGNRRAARVVDNLNDQWHRLRLGFTALEGRMGHSTEEHSQFISCILAGDGENAERLIGEHLSNVHHALHSLLVNVIVPYTGDVV